MISGTKFVGEISMSSVTIGVAYDYKNGLFYAGGYSCECVIVVNAKTLKVVTTISISEPASGIAYSAKSGYIIASTFSDPGYYAVINPSTNKVVTTLDACGYYAEFMDSNLKNGTVYAADRESSSGYGCVDEISGTKIVKTVTNSGAVGVSVNQKTGYVPC